MSKLQISTNGPYGVNDELKNGIGLFSYQLDSPNIVNQLGKSEKLSRVRCGISVDIMSSIPLPIAPKEPRLGGLKGSNLFNEVLSGRIDTIDTRDIFSNLESEVSI